MGKHTLHIANPFPLRVDTCSALFWPWHFLLLLPEADGVLHRDGEFRG